MTKRMFREFGIACGLMMGFSAAGVAGPKFDTWTTLHNDRHGFAIAYPADVFEQKVAAKSDDGRVLVSKDGRAKLLVGAFDNSESHTLAEYRDFLLTEQYAGATIDYAPVRKTWFVLSGVKAGETFYQRVSFTCGGKLINSWAMLYPEAERRLYDKVLEAVARTFQPGAGADGNCS
ncbi:MAG: hypothetical protein ACRCS9_11260 [Hyphomicrobium sp.]